MEYGGKCKQGKKEEYSWDMHLGINNNGWIFKDYEYLCVCVLNVLALGT